MYWNGSPIKGYRIPFMDLHLARTFREAAKCDSPAAVEIAKLKENE